ncbi:hypothetical protein B0H16DRAFT_1574352 [Mycena metata]|uniref:DUF8040 domain-containing protein n=1 Tax=Mycena metata TaxID=1033252 RepID=A0AAD7MWS8_9AGAR|nr:hypothetical protein B0H16DRAFT_1574352 [Mycena metata]
MAVTGIGRNHTTLRSSLGNNGSKSLCAGIPNESIMSLGAPARLFHAIARVAVLRYSDSKHVSLEEQLAIFLYICQTGLGCRHVAEHFQHSNETITKFVDFLQKNGVY